MNVEFKGIDVSVHNGSLNWPRIKRDGVQFAILRTGYGIESPKQKDGKFDINYANAKAAGIPIGAYHYSYAKSVSEAEKEAEFVIKIIGGKQFEYPIFFDIEDRIQQNLSKETCTKMVQAFCNKLEKAEYWAGVYSYDSFFKTHLDESIQSRYSVWVARVESVKPVSAKRYDMWQYSWEGAVLGSSKETDMNISYKDFPSLIKKAGKNGFGTALEKPKLYRVTANADGLTNEQADSLISKLTELGMEAEKNEK